MRIVPTMLALLIPVGYFIVDLIVFQFAYEMHTAFARVPVTIPAGEDAIPGARVTGDGSMAKVYNSLIQSLMPVEDLRSASHMWHVCFDEPSEPDYWFLLVSGQCRRVPTNVCSARTYHCHGVCDAVYGEHVDGTA
jgi:hypothetical protein